MRFVYLLMKLTIILLVFIPISSVSQSLYPSASNQNYNKIVAQVDSVTKLQQQTTKTLHKAEEELKELKIRVNSEMTANYERIESFKETTNQLFWLFVSIGAISSVLGAVTMYRTRKREAQLRADYQKERQFYEDRAKSYESQQIALHSRVLRIYENQAEIGEKYRMHSGEIFSQQEIYSRGMAEVTTAFKDILDNIKGVLEFKVEESELALKAMEKQAEAAELLPKIQEEFDALKRERDERMDDLLKDTKSLIRSRHEYTEPDRELQSAIFQFRIKMDGMSKMFLEKYSNQPKYSLIFYYRGLIAFLDGDISTANKMLKISEQQLPSAETDFATMPQEIRFPTAFTQFYLALIEKNYGNIRSAQDHIEKSYLMYGMKEKKELLTLVTLAEILSYTADGIDRARNILEDLFERVEKIVKAGALTKAETQYIQRAHLIYGNTSYIIKEWEEARVAYQKVIEINEKNYYAHHSLGQILRVEKKPKQAQDNFDKALEHLLDSNHLETKPERSTLITLNALAHYCLHQKDQIAAKKYLDAIKEHMTKIREMDGFELKLFSLKKKRLITKDEFWDELLEEV